MAEGNAPLSIEDHTPHRSHPQTSEDQPRTSLRNYLKEELPTYLARVNSLHEEFDTLDWWKRNTSVLPNWSAIAKKVILIQPSFAAAERAFSILKLHLESNKGLVYKII